MARKENLVHTTSLQVALNDALINQLKLLVYSGKWGKTVSEAVERIVSAKIGEIITEADQAVDASKQLEQKLRGSGIFERSLKFEDLRATDSNENAEGDDAQPEG